MNLVPKLDNRVILEYLSSLDCPRSLSIAILWRYHQYDDIVSMSFNPLFYNSVNEARLALCATDFLRKHADLPTSVDKSAVSYQNFYNSEAECKLTNERLLRRNDGGSLLFRVSRKIADVLGEFDPVEFLDLAGWGPGSTLRIKRKDSSHANKFRRESECTQPLYQLLKPWFCTQFPNWAVKTRIYEGNKVITVPKNAKTDRTIGVEPSLNLFFQKGVGSMIRKRLRFFGVDLNSQVPNQEFAKIGSRNGELATVDFSAASDTISSILVLDLLPFKWFKVLDCLRSPRGYIEGSLIEYEKFSSMGNGFTFELESLIFWAIAKAIVPEDHPLWSSIIVFGDDVILPSEYVDRYNEACSFLGFKINMTKSYWSGYYRESCGKHYWDGIDITPIYLRHYLKGDEVLKFHNRLIELSIRFVGFGFRDKRFRSLVSILKDSSLIKVRVPNGYGDIGLICDFDECSPVFNREYHRGYNIKAYIATIRPVIEDDGALLLAKLFSLSKLETIDRYETISSGNEVSYASRGSYKYKTLWFPDWPLLGEWI